MFNELNTHTESPIETEFLRACVRVGLRVEPQYKIGPIRADFAVPHLRMVIECDGKEFHSGSKAIQNDQNRDKIYEKHEWNVLRLSGGAILADSERIVEAIKRGVLRAGVIDKAAPHDWDDPYRSSGPYFENDEAEDKTSNVKSVFEILKAKYGIEN